MDKKNVEKLSVEEICRKIITSYNDLIFDPGKEVKKWGKYGLWSNCLLCLKFDTNCPSCPISNHTSQGCVDESTDGRLLGTHETMKLEVQELIRLRKDSYKYEVRNQEVLMQSVARARRDFLLGRMNSEGIIVPEKISSSVYYDKELNDVLPPCPFCKSIDLKYRPQDEYHSVWAYLCASCKTIGPEAYFYVEGGDVDFKDLKLEAARLWINRRGK